MTRPATIKGTGPHRYAFGDETGEAGFRFGRGSSSHFVAGLVLTNQPDDLREYVSGFQRKLGLKTADEISFHRSPDRNRVAFLEGLLTYDLAIRVLAVDKVALSAALRSLRRADFYVWAFGVLLFHSADELERATVVLDEFGSPAATVRALKRTLRQSLPGPRFRQHIRRVQSRRSESEPNLQIADMVTGAAYRFVTGESGRFYQIIQSRARIVKVEKENLPNYPAK